MPQYHFAASKQNTNIKLRCLQHKIIISNINNLVSAALECGCSQRTLKYRYGGPLGHHLVLLLSCWVKYNTKTLRLST